MQRLVHVGQAQQKGRMIAMHVREQGDARLEEHPHIFHQGVQFLVGEGHEAPVFLPGPVVDFLEGDEFFFQVFGVRRADGDPPALVVLLRDAQHLLHLVRVAGRLQGEIVAVDVHHLDEARLVFDQALVVRGIVGIEHHRRIVEAFDQQSAFVVGGEAGRTAQRIVAFGAHVVRRRLEQGVGGFLVVEHFEEAEKADMLVIELVMAVVDERRNRADRLSPAPGDEIIAFHMFPTGILLAIQLAALERNQGRNPVGIPLVDFPGQLDKGIEVRFAFDFADGHRFGHRTNPLEAYA